MMSIILRKEVEKVVEEPGALHILARTLKKDSKLLDL